MADRRIFRVDKDDDGDIVCLCNSAADWSPRSLERVIIDIELGSHTYYVMDDDYVRAEVQVVQGVYKKYLKTDPDSSCKNNLDNLPPC